MSGMLIWNVRYVDIASVVDAEDQEESRERTEKIKIKKGKYTNILMRTVNYRGNINIPDISYQHT